MNVTVRRRVVVSDVALTEVDMDLVDELAVRLIGPKAKTTLIGTVQDEWSAQVFEPFTNEGAVLVTAVARGDVPKLLEMLRERDRAGDTNHTATTGG